MGHLTRTIRAISLTTVSIPSSSFSKINKLRSTEELVSSRAVIWTVDALYYIIPKTGQIHDLAGGLAKHEVVAWQPLWTSVLFALVMLLLALSVFRRKDF